MATTTAAAIQEALAKTIEDFTPAGAGGSPRAKYRRVASTKPWPEKPMSEIDRGFEVGQVVPSNDLQIYPTSRLVNATVDIRVGHQLFGQNGGMDDTKRRANDIEQLIMELEKNDYRPSGVYLIRINSTNTNIQERYTLTTLNFRLIYERAW